MGAEPVSLTSKLIPFSRGTTPEEAARQAPRSGSWAIVEANGKLFMCSPRETGEILIENPDARIAERIVR